MFEGLDPAAFEAQRAELADLRDRLAALRAQNARLAAQNRELRNALDAHIARSRSTGMFGSLEMNAGTCVGPRRSQQ